MLRSLTHRLADRVTARELDRLSLTHPLRYLFLEVTRKCNLRCVYCGSGCSPEWRGEELASAVWIDVLRQIAGDFDAKGVMLAFTGGEPLIKPGFADILDEAGRLGFSFGMVSNGTLLTRDMATRLVASGIGSISLSLDGLPDFNDALRGSGAAEKVVRAVTHLRDAAYRGRLEVISTITKPAVPHLDRVRHFLATLRIADWRLAPLIPIGRATARADLVPDARDLREVLDFVRRGRTDGFLPRPEFGEECYLGREYEGEVRPFRFQCRAGLTVGGILSDGRIGACPELADCFAQGSIRSDRFVDVWQGRYAVFRDRSWTRHGACGACDAFDACRGGSLHLYPHLDAEPERCFYRMLGGQAALEGQTP